MRTFSNHVSEDVEEAPVNRTYDLFEKTPDGDLVWHSAVLGLDAAMKEVEALARRTGNECLIMHLLTQEVVARVFAEASPT
jgi:hypothetical protein